MSKYKLLIRIYCLYSKIVSKMNGLFNRRKCFICGRTFFSYLPVCGDGWYQEQIKKYGINFNFLDMTYNRWEYRCPYCKSIDRTRLIMAYICKKYQRKENVKVLYFAPTPGGISFLKNRMKKLKVDTNDLYRLHADYHYDIQNLRGISDNTYDLVICSHVLEHVGNDRIALKELHRITKEGGEVLILVPLDLKRDWFDEANGLSEYENRKRFGQSDHVRRYTENELVKRIREAGFNCRVFTRENVEKSLIGQNAFNKNIRMYIAKRESSNERFKYKSQCNDGYL